MKRVAAGAYLPTSQNRVLHEFTSFDKNDTNIVSYPDIEWLTASIDEWEYECLAPGSLGIYARPW